MRRRYSEAIVTVSRHACEQYLSRVGSITWDALIRLTQQQLAEGPEYDDGNYLLLEGVWWAYERDGDRVTLVTCYGRTSMRLPAAIRWARQHNDRIDLNRMIDL